MHDDSEALSLVAIIVAQKGPTVEQKEDLRFYIRHCTAFPKRVTIAPHCGPNALTTAHLDAQEKRL